MHKFSAMDGVFRVVTPEELERLTRCGWQVVGAFEKISYDMVTEKEQRLHPRDPNDYNHQAVVDVFRAKPNSCLSFLVRQTEDSARAELFADMEAIQKALQEARGEKKKAVEDLGKRLDELVLLKADLERHHGLVAARTEEAGKVRETARKLEGDIAKIRKAIGERSFSEILPPPEKKSV